MTTRPRIVPDPPQVDDFALRLWRTVDEETTLAGAAARVVELVADRCGADAVALSVRGAPGDAAGLAGYGRLLEAARVDVADPARDPLAHPLADGGLLDVPDTRDDTTWPDWSAAAARRGVRCARLVGLPPVQGRPAVLELYAARPHAFDEGTAPVADTARQAGLALRQVDRMAGLEQAGHDRTLVGQASGLLMERYHLGADQATGYLVRSAERAGLDVHALARELVAAQDRAAAHTRRSFAGPPSTGEGDAGAVPPG